jgi:TolB protein
MTRYLRGLTIGFASLALVAPVVARAQDTVPYRGIRLTGTYDPTRDKVAIAVLPVNGAFGDSIRTIVMRDLERSDRFTLVSIDASDMAALRNTGAAAGLNYPLFARLNTVAVAEITPVATGLHLALHDVGQTRVANVWEMPLAGAGLSRDWRMSVHRASDEIEKLVTGRPGISASRIAYTRGNAIRIVDSDGAAEITVPTEEMGTSPAWSPDGTTLVYASYGPGSRIYLMDLATGRSRAIIGPTQNVLYLTPTFSPDGQSIVYARSTGDQSDIYIAPVAQPQAARRLTVARGIQNTNPIFSPNGRRVVYQSSASGPLELYIVDADGTGNDKLTDYDFSEKVYRSDPDWSPDGRLIAYQERVNNDKFQLRTIQVSGSTPKYLTSEGENEQPSWAPDGRHLVFTSTRTGVRQLWILDVESNTTRQLTKSAGSRLAAWSGRLP